MSQRGRRWEDTVYDILAFFIGEEIVLSASSSNPSGARHGRWMEKVRWATAGLDRLLRRRGRAHSLE